MSAVVVKSKLKYTYLAKGRYWRFRHAPTVGDVPLPGTPGDPEFHARYSELLKRVTATPKAAPAQSSFAWLVGKYRKSPEFAMLRPRTRDDYEISLNVIVEELGDQPYAFTTRKMLKAVRDGYSATPRKADKLKAMMSRLYSWADEEEHVPEGFNPAAGLKKLRKKPEPYVPWSDEEIDLLLANAPSHVVTPVMLAAYTGQRASDVVSMTWTQYKGSTIRVKQDKTGEPLDIACHPKLRAYLDSLRATDRKGVVMATSAEDRSYTAGSLSQALTRAIRQIDEMPHRTMHGLRYAAAARLEEAGCTVAEIAAIIGHRTYQMAMKYIAQRKAAQRAIAKLEAQGS
ncbi:tyrosine-type recombinase/integrase [Sphingobium yanoikuyae]|uniref:tyrosine-type recombinase/integrase n=1 Tax=Sphingobium yanoikuyae TaxID=13690 RepID=UPI0028AF9F97|nr:tyrosine-type recombinase/integrase [Sphingobium yanoikuyae]